MNVNNTFIKSAIVSLFMFALIMIVSLAIMSYNNTVNLAFAATNIVGANLVIPNTCIPIISNSAIGFGSVAGGAFASTSSAENVINFGNAASNIFVYGGNWIYYNNAIWVTNTLWSPINAYANNIIGTQLVNTITDTKIPIGLNGAGNVIWFGLNVPSSAFSGAYTQTVNILLSC
jgi:hypothetical protein